MPDHSDFYWLNPHGIWERQGRGDDPSTWTEWRCLSLPLRPVRTSSQYFAEPPTSRRHRGPWDFDYDWAFCHTLGIRWD